LKARCVGALELDVGAEIGSEQFGEFGGVVADIHVAANDAGGAQLLDDAGARYLNSLAVETEVRELQAVVESSPTRPASTDRTLLSAVPMPALACSMRILLSEAAVTSSSIKSAA
jgi:hypothetical protein